MAPHPAVLASILAFFSGFHGFFIWNDAPNPVPVWWTSMVTQPVYYMPRWFGFTFLPVMMVAIPYIFHVFATNDCKIKTLSGNAKDAVEHLINIPAQFLFIVHNSTILDAFVSRTGEINSRDVSTIIALVLMIWAGHNFKYVPPNDTVGLLTPWTLRSDHSWTETHTHSASILQIFGILLLTCRAFDLTGVSLLVVTLVLWLGSYLYLIIYSYLITFPLFVSFTVSVFGSDETSGGIREPLVATEEV